MDVTELILFQHYQQSRAFALLDDIARDDIEALAAVWSRLQVLLEVHAEAEERFIYPQLLALRTREGGSPASEVRDAIKDHNEIRDGIRKVGAEDPGTAGWWAAVLETRRANGDHMAEEERDDLPDFRRGAGLPLRHDVAVQFIAYESEHPAGIVPKNKDPDAYVRRNT